MNPIALSSCFLTLLLAFGAQAQSDADLKSALTFHASFDKDLKADFSKGDRTAYVKQGKEVVEALPNEDAKIAEDAGRFGNALWFTKKAAFRPQYKSEG